MYLNGDLGSLQVFVNSFNSSGSVWDTFSIFVFKNAIARLGWLKVGILFTQRHRVIQISSLALPYLFSCHSKFLGHGCQLFASM